MAKIVVSYRRADSAAIAGRIFDRLTGHYGDDSVFMDVDNIPFGIDFRHHIKNVLEYCDAVLVVVGPRWTGAGADGTRILHDADPVRVEVETALQRGVPIIPILVDGARMPEATELPESLRDFSFINAAPVDNGRDFRQHMDRLIRALDASFAAKGVASPSASAASATVPPAVQSAPRRAWFMRLAIPLALVVAVAAGSWALLPKNWFGSSVPPENSSNQPSVAYPAYKGPVYDGVGMLHADSLKSLTQKLADLESKTTVQVVVALLKDAPASPDQFADDLARRWKLGGEQRNGILLIICPGAKTVTLNVGNVNFDRAAANALVQRIDQQLSAGDTLGALIYGVDSLVEILTGDPKAWLARVSGASKDAPSVAPPPATYRVLPNVSQGVQNLRKGPGVKYPIVVAIPAGSTGITISGCRKSEDATRPWCAANWRSYSGWISSCCIVDEKTGAPPPPTD